MVVEGGMIGAEVKAGQLPISTNEMRAARRAIMITSITDIFLMAQRGFFDHGFLGLAQVDPYGSINTSRIGGSALPAVRLPGGGGANDIASLCRQVFIVTTHERRRFVEKLDFVTSPGHLGPGRRRAEAGLMFGGPRKVVTNLALMDFAPATNRMRVIALQPGVELAEVQANTGFQLELAPDIQRLASPTDVELATLRSLGAETELARPMAS